MKLKEQIGGFLVKGVAKAFNLSLGQLAHLWDTGGDLSGQTDLSKARSPYKQVSLVYTCINELIKGIQSLPLVLSTTGEQIIESGPAYDLLFNREQTWQNFVEELIGHFALSRDVFVTYLDSDGDPASGIGSSKIADLLIVPGEQMRPLTDNGQSDGQLVGWEFWGLSGKKVKLTPNECRQWRNFNPYDKFHGIGPIAAAKNDINYDFAASLYNASALANGAEPGLIVTFPEPLNDDEVRMHRKEIESRHAGAGKTKRTMILSKGADVKTVTMKLADLQVAELTEWSDKKICSAFGVPPGVAGLITEAQYSHGPALRQFIFNTIIPLANSFADLLTKVVSKVDDGKSKRSRNGNYTRNKFYREAHRLAAAMQAKSFAWFDANQHPVVQEYMREVTEQVLKATAAGVPLNNLIEAHDLPYEQVPWGDDWWIGMGQVPASFILEAGTEGITGPSLPEGQPPEGEEVPQEPKLNESFASSMKDKFENDQKASAQQRLRLWRGWIASWLGIERECTQAYRLLFVKQQNVLLKKLAEVMNESKSSDQSRATNDEIVARVVFDIEKENGRVRIIHRMFFDKASELGIRQTLTEILGLKGKELKKLTDQAKVSPVMKAKLQVSTEKITKINKTTQRMVARQLEKGLEAGEDLKQITSRVKNVLGCNLKRAQAIARTSTSGAVNTGRHSGMRAAGVQKKAWVDSHDNEVRKSHKDAGEDYADGIPLEQAFIVGGESLMYPGDPAGSAAEIANCRCLQVAIAAAGKTFDLNSYGIFYSYANMQKDINDENGTDKQS